MKTETKVEHTFGAIRAAKLMAINPKVRQLAMGLILREEFSNELATIIDRETAAPKILEALELSHRHFIQSSKLTTDDREMLDIMWAAIRKAKGVIQ
jgi:hypothetical protein